MSYLVFKDQKSFMGYFGQKPGADTTALYEKLVGEEYIELAEALLNTKAEPGSAEAIGEVAKEALDCVYVLTGLLHALNLDPQTLWDVVHQSNIDKIKHPCVACGATGIVATTEGDEPCRVCNGQGHVYEVRRREDGKVLKPPGWQKPDLTPLIEQMRG